VFLSRDADGRGPEVKMLEVLDSTFEWELSCSEDTHGNYVYGVTKECPLAGLPIRRHLDPIS
jgi:hypothetical protein